MTDDPNKLEELGDEDLDGVSGGSAGSVSMASGGLAGSSSDDLLTAANQIAENNRRKKEVREALADLRLRTAGD